MNHRNLLQPLNQATFTSKPASLNQQAKAGLQVSVHILGEGISPRLRNIWQTSSHDVLFRSDLSRRGLGA